MGSNKKTARIAGLLYLVVVITGIVDLIYVPSKLIAMNDASATLHNIIVHETLFRTGIFCGILSYLFFILLPLALYKLLAPVNKTQALLMVMLAIVSVPISLTNMVNKFDVLTLISNAQYLKVFDDNNLQAQVLLKLSSFNNGNLVASIFWGLWLFPFGYLVFKSGFLPKVLGILLMLGCFGYLINFTGYFFFADYNKTIIAQFINLPAGLGEIGITLWLLIIGTKNKK